MGSEEKTKEKKLRRKLGRKVITVVVGEGKEKEEFVVHEDLICYISEFFRKAIKGDWKEAEDRVIFLPEDDPDCFAEYLQMLYLGDVPWSDRCEYKSANIISWTSVFVLADKLMDMNIKNMMITLIYIHREDVWLYPKETMEAVRIIYNNTLGPCGIRQLLTDAHFYHQEAPVRDKASVQLGQVAFEDVAAPIKTAPKEFLKDLAICSAAKVDRYTFCTPPGTCCKIYDCFHDYVDKYLEGGAANAGGKTDTKETTGEDGIYHCTCCPKRKRPDSS